MHRDLDRDDMPAHVVGRHLAADADNDDRANTWVKTVLADSGEVYCGLQQGFKVATSTMTPSDALTAIGISAPAKAE